MLRIALKWGVVLGIAICVWTLCVHALGWYTTDLAKGQLADQLAIILPVAALFLAISEYSRYVARTLSLVDALGVGVFSGLVSVPISAGFLWLYHHYFNPQWLDLLVSYERQKLASSGTSEARVNETIARLISSGSDRSQLLGALIGTLIISIGISVVAWGILRFLGNRRDKAIQTLQA